MAFVLMKGAGGKAFCAGGDIRGMAPVAKWRLPIPVVTESCVCVCGVVQRSTTKALPHGRPAKVLVETPRAWAIASSTTSTCSTIKSRRTPSPRSPSSTASPVRQASPSF